MADEKITALLISNPIDIDPGDLLYAVEDTGTTPASGALKASQLMFNRYKIVPSVAANDLTVALKHLDGTDPSADRPLYFKIGDAVRAVTGALSVTKADATNWFNAGSAELATKEIDYFVYLGYNATDGVVIGFSRIPCANLYSDFSATSTNERYAAISTITNAAAGDNYVVIGRFAATLSAGAGYTWTVPTFTSVNLIQSPIYETRWLDWQPTYAATGSMTYTSVTTTLARYRLTGTIGNTWLICNGTTGGSASNGLTATQPITPSTTSFAPGNIVVVDGSGVSGQGTHGTIINVYKYDASNFALAAGKQIRFMGTFQLQ